MCLSLALGAACCFGGAPGPFGAVGELVGCMQGRELGVSAPRLPRFILLASFSSTLLAVSILDIVYDCHLYAVLQS